MTENKVAEVPKSPTSIHIGWQLGFAALSGCGATIFVQPMDLVKNRMQTNRGLGV